MTPENHRTPPEPPLQRDVFSREHHLSSVSNNKDDAMSWSRQSFSTDSESEHSVSVSLHTPSSSLSFPTGVTFNAPVLRGSPSSTAAAGSMPIELLDLIFKWVDSTDDLMQCVLVSKTYFRSAIAFVWRQKTIWTDNWEQLRILFARPRSLFHDYRQQFTELQILTPTYRASLLGFPSEPAPNPFVPASLPSPSTSPRIAPITSSPINGSPIQVAMGSVPADALLPRSRSRDGHRSPSPSSATSMSSTHPHDFGRLQGLRRFLQGCSRLTAFNCDYPTLNDEDLWVVSRACPYLKALSIVSSTMPAGRFGDEGLLAVTTHCLDLRHLRIRAVGGYACFTDRGIEAIAKAYKARLLTFALEWLGLSLRGSNGVAPPGLAHGAVPSIGHSGSNAFGPSSHELGPSDFDHSNSFSGPGGSFPLNRNGSGDSSMPLESAVRRFNEALSLVVTSNPNLNMLSLDWPVGMTETLTAAATHLASLESLRIGNFTNISVLASVLATNPGLQRLCLIDLPSQFDPAVLFHEAARLQAAIAHSTSPESWTPPTPTADAEALPLAATFPLTATPSPFHLNFSLNLKELELDGVGRLASLLDIVVHFSNLKRLRISPSGLSASIATPHTDVIAATAFSMLPRLVAVEVPIFGPGPIMALAEHCVELEELDIVDGRLVTDQSLIVLVKRCTNLTHLHLGSATDLLDTSINILARTLNQRLIHLALPISNRHITPRVLETLSMYCPNLDTLAHLPASVTFVQLMEWLPKLRMLRTLGMSVAGVALSSAGAGRYFLSREEMEGVKGACRRLKVIYYTP
ncbi:hypothetical protein BC829DRAFT_224585 [Chytridium lagenaria]|nr:hypothetical protein BC829DRAFT_224585 [Chytridium lagenaria]